MGGIIQSSSLSQSGVDFPGLGGVQSSNLLQAVSTLELLQLRPLWCFSVATHYSDGVLPLLYPPLCEAVAGSTEELTRILSTWGAGGVGWLN